jgi:RNA polymerase sigma factor (sigma-70 family)
MIEQEASTERSYRIFAEAVVTVSNERRWELDHRMQRAYAHALARLHPSGCPAALAERIVVHYHLDHSVVQALCARDEQRSTDAWAAWMPQVIAVLRREDLDYGSDSASDIDDLAQIARIELVRSLPEFRYESRYSTWAYAVIVRSIRNELRARTAQKRTAQVISLAASVAQRAPNTEASNPEALATASVLLKLAYSILQAHPDQRLAHIFGLWVVEDMRVVEIGARIGLSQSRVRVLLGQITALLQQDPSMRRWTMEYEAIEPDGLQPTNHDALRVS